MSDPTACAAAGSDRRICVHHPDAPAIAICADCGGDICGGCHTSDLRGYAVCPACRQARAPRSTPWDDPRADYSPANFGRTLAAALTGPHRFFRQLPVDTRVGPAIAFGLLCMTLGLLMSHLWKVLLLPEVITETTEAVGLTAQQVRITLFATAPFWASAGFIFQTLVLHASLRLFGARPALRTTIRIVGYAAAGYVLLAVPPIGEFTLGHFLAIIWIFNLQATAVRAYFDLGPWKSLFAVVIPLMLATPFLG